VWAGVILTGDCVELMVTLEANSVDAIMTDPPYGLEFMGKEWDRLGGIGKMSHSGPVAPEDSKFGNGIVYSASTSYSLGAIPVEDAAEASALLNTVRVLGLALGIRRSDRHRGADDVSRVGTGLVDERALFSSERARHQRAVARRERVRRSIGIGQRCERGPLAEREDLHGA